MGLTIRPGNGVCVVVGGSNVPLTEHGKTVYRAKADRKSNRKDNRGAQSAKSKGIAYDTWQDEKAKGRPESRIH